MGRGVWKINNVNSLWITPPALPTTSDFRNHHAKELQLRVKGQTDPNKVMEGKMSLFSDGHENNFQSMQNVFISGYD